MPRSAFFVGQPMVIGWSTEEPPPVAPVITSALARSGQVDVVFNYTITATGRPTPTFSVTGLPGGLTFSGNRISGTPTTAGSSNVTLEAHSTAGNDTKTLVLTIAAAPVLNPPVINSPLTANGQVGVAFSYTITASNSPTTFSATPLPGGLARSGATISGTPTAAAEGSHNITIRATNNDGYDEKTLVVTIAAAAPVAPIITSPLTASGRVGQAFTYTITATGTAPITFNATNLPGGLTRTGAVISGTPTTEVTNHNITIEAHGAGTDTKTLVITIGPASVGWSVTYNFGQMPGGLPTNFAGGSQIPLNTWAGWLAAYDADMTDALYDAPTPADLPVNMFATYVGQAEVKVDFDNWTGTPAGNKITTWGYRSDLSPHAVEIRGNNATGQQIALRLVKH